MPVPTVDMNNITMQDLNETLNAAKNGKSFKIKGKQGNTYKNNNEAKKRLRQAILAKFLEQQAKGDLTPSVIKPALDWIEQETKKNAGIVHAPNLVILQNFANHIRSNTDQHESLTTDGISSGHKHSIHAQKILRITQDMRHEGGIVAKIRRGLNRIARALISNPKFDPKKTRETIKNSLLAASQLRTASHYEGIYGKKLRKIPKSKTNSSRSVKRLRKR